jgi:hypothetical protein
MIVLSMVDVSDASVTRVLEETIMILQEEVAEMDKDVAVLILGVVIVVEEVAELVATTTATTILETTMAMNITTWMVHHMDGAPQQGTANDGQGANQQNAENHHLDMIGDPPPAGQGIVTGWQGRCN